MRCHDVFHIHTSGESKIDNTVLLIAVPVKVAVNAQVFAFTSGGDTPVFGYGDCHVEVCEVREKLGGAKELVAIECTFRTDASDFRKPLCDEEEPVVTTSSCGGRGHSAGPVHVKHQFLTGSNCF